MNRVTQMLSEHPFMADISHECLELVARGASEAKYDEDEFLFREHQDANNFYLIVEGSVALKIHVPHAGPLPIQTISAGQVLGWSWLIPPYKWHFDARAFSPITAIVLDAGYLRRLFDEHSEIGYRFLRRLTHVLAERLQATRLQLLDVYQGTT
jgi:CRP-like cAMP-binding protein